MHSFIGRTAGEFLDTLESLFGKPIQYHYFTDGYFKSLEGAAFLFSVDSIRAFGVSFEIWGPYFLKGDLSEYYTEEFMINHPDFELEDSLDLNLLRKESIKKLRYSFGSMEHDLAVRKYHDSIRKAEKQELAKKRKRKLQYK